MSDKLGKMITDVIEVEKNGVKVTIKQQYDKEINDINIDFSEHDKVFEDKYNVLKEEYDKKCKDYKSVSGLLSTYQMENESLKQRIAELESKETIDLPFEPMECANYLINATYERETNGLEPYHNLPEKVNSDRYTVDELEQIAEHLLIYCKHNKGNGNE